MSELLSSRLPVVHTYSCISIEKILSLQENGEWKVKKENLAEFVSALVHRLLSLMMNVSSQNEYTVKCLMRVIIFFGTDMAPFLETLLNGIVKTLEMISQNPGNPNFIHYCFECIAGLTRYVCTENPSSHLPLLETKLFPFFQSVLTADIAEFVPYIFQVLAQLAELHGEYEELPSSYQSLLPVLFTPSLWNRNGYIPGMVRLLQAFLRKSMNHIMANNQLTPILGVFQNLVASKVHDYYGMSLIESIVETCDMSQLEPFLPEIVQIMLVRLQKGRTIRFTRAFIVFISFLSIKYGSEIVVSLLNRIQDGLFVQVFEHVWLPNVVQEANPKDRKICATGLALYLSCPTLIELPNLWLSVLSTVLSLLEGYQENPTQGGNHEMEGSREYDIQFSQLALVGNRENIQMNKVPEPDQMLVNNFTEVVANNESLKGVIQSSLSNHFQQLLASHLQKLGRSI
ncbi:Exportin-2 [Galdieria sulphuraria]|nr:Exportin-2 [Galdieria sulphuraria]